MTTFESLPLKITIGDKYGPAMNMTDPEDAAAYFERLVEHSMAHGNDREKAEKVERGNLGYYAGYYSDETRERVERLFSCAHPFFGKIEKRGRPTTSEAIRAGENFARTRLTSTASTP